VVTDPVKVIWMHWSQSLSQNEGPTCAHATGIALRPACVACKEHLVTMTPYWAPMLTWGLWCHWCNPTFTDLPRCVFGIYGWMNQWNKPMTTHSIPEDVRSDLEFWLNTLSEFKSTCLIQSQKPLEVTWVVDTSTGFGIGVLIGRRWNQF
jgi:hypothetical protein